MAENVKHQQMLALEGASVFRKALDESVDMTYDIAATRYGHCPVSSCSLEASLPALGFPACDCSHRVDCFHLSLATSSLLVYLASVFPSFCDSFSLFLSVKCSSTIATAF